MNSSIAMLLLGSMFVVILVLLASNVSITYAIGPRANSSVRNLSTEITEAYCDLELNCKGDISDMPTSMKLPIRVVKGPPGHQGAKGDKGEDGIPGLPGLPGLSAPSPPKLAFFVGLGAHFGPVHADTTVIFDRILTNVGGAYNSETGQFRSPVNGTYQFNVVVSSSAKYKGAVMLVKNGEMVATVWATSEPSWSTSSNTAILTLDRDDLVWVMALKKAPYLYGYMYTTFSGFLIFEN